MKQLFFNYVPWKVIIASASATGLGYFLCKYQIVNNDRKRKESKKEEREELMEEIIIELLTYINSFERTNNFNNKVTENIYQIVDSIAQKAHRRKRLNKQEYVIAMKKYRESKNDNSVVEKRIEGTLRGNVTRELFTCDPLFTKHLTINVYRWIALSDAYVNYKGIIGCAEKMQDREYFAELIKASIPDKLVRRSIILKKAIKNKSNYFSNINALKKAYCKYRLEDKEFDKDANMLIRLNNELNNIIYEKQEINEFFNDPFYLRLEDIKDYCLNLQSKYILHKNLHNDKTDEKKIVLDLFKQKVILQESIKLSKELPRENEEVKSKENVVKGTEEEIDYSQFQEFSSGGEELIDSSDEEYIKCHNSEDAKSDDTSLTEREEETRIRRPYSDDIKRVFEFVNDLESSIVTEGSYSLSVKKNNEEQELKLLKSLPPKSKLNK